MQALELCTFMSMQSYYFPIQVRFADTDALGHVFFANYFTFFDEAVSGLLRALGHSYQDLRAQNMEFVYAHAESDYVTSARFEEVLHVYARVVKIGTTSVTFECAALRVSDNTSLARGKLVCVMRDVSTGIKTAVPESFRRAVAEFAPA